ncbi:MAG TPA: ABC transporter ATP-binding protein [Dehalococcoidia bacterium]|nr:ABC transporter ATP-binding protein [Dehalococcoidia bacterium]
MVAPSAPPDGEPADRRSIVLSARGVTKSFGNFTAVDSVDLDVHEGDIHALVGPNGGGKSTLLNLFGGQLLPSSGEILFDGHAVGLSKPNARARSGMGRSFQLTSIVPGFTCLENVVIAVQARQGLLRLLRLRSRREDLDRAGQLLGLVGLDDSRDVPAELLAHGQQRQLEVAIALGGRPKLLLLDEPSSGMSGHERQQLGQLLKAVAIHATILMAEHDVSLVRAIATRVTAFSEGRKVAEGSAESVFQAPEVQRVFLRGARDV